MWVFAQHRPGAVESPPGGVHLELVAKPLSAPTASPSRTLLEGGRVARKGVAVVCLPASTLPAHQEHDPDQQGREVVERRKRIPDDEQ
jgi:hypothetical protein